jgi:hypothetical protein
LVGRAAHVLILEGLERFREDFAVGGPINKKTGLPFGPATKAWTQWAETVGKPVLSDSQFETIERMNESVAMHEAAVDLLQYGIAEAVVRAEYCGFPCQIRIDWLERVFVLDSDGAMARKANEGTVDECKREIVNLLEGGENAFKVRKCRYAY